MKGLKVTQIVKEIRFEGVCGELEQKVYLWSWSISTHMTPFLILYFLLQVWKTVILDLGETCLFHTKTNPKEIGADISISFWPLCFILTYCKVIVHFCCRSNLQPSCFCKSVFYDFDCELYRFPHGFDADYVKLAK